MDSEMLHKLWDLRGQMHRSVNIFEMALIDSKEAVNDIRDKLETIETILNREAMARSKGKP